MRVLLPALLAVTVLLAAGCGGSSGTHSTTNAPAPTTTPKPADNGEASKPVNQIVADAEVAAKGASAVHVTGTGTTGGTPLVLDLYLDGGRGGRGHLKVNGLSFDIVRVNETAYFKGDNAFWKHFGGGVAAALLKGRWLSEPVTHGALASFAPLTDIAKLFHAILSSHGKLSKGPTKTIDGVSAIGIVDHSHNGGTLYIATTGPPYPLEVDAPPGQHGVIRFEGWNQSVTVTRPANAIDVSSLKGFNG